MNQPRRLPGLLRPSARTRLPRREPAADDPWAGEDEAWDEAPRREHDSGVRFFRGLGLAVGVSLLVWAAIVVLVVRFV